MRKAQQLLHDEINDLGARYGRAGVARDSVYFHTSRAKSTLDAVVLASPARTDAEIMARLIHLAAVCMRLAMAWNGEETG